MSSPAGLGIRPHRRSPTIDRGVKQGVVDLPLRQTGREGGWIEDCHAEQALGLTPAPHLHVGARWQDLVGIWLPGLSPELGIVESLDLGWRRVYAEDPAIECRGVPLRRGAPLGADRPKF